jgi:hypothetical protein
MSGEPALEELQRHVDAIEGGYEYLLAYAAQGLTTDEGHQNSEQLRSYLARMDEGIAGLEAACRNVIAASGAPSTQFDNFLQVLARDASAALAALRVVSGMKGVSSQLVDNLNASVHVRALLTDLFLVDEALKGLRT